MLSTTGFAPSSFRVTGGLTRATNRPDPTYRTRAKMPCGRCGMVMEPRIANRDNPLCTACRSVDPLFGTVDWYGDVADDPNMSTEDDALAVAS